jgi:hypothetical protein
MTEFTTPDGEVVELPPGAVAFERISVDNIEATAATQMRKRLDRGVIDQYTEDLKNGDPFPPVHVYREENSERNILADGFHRHRAFVNAERSEIGCWIYEGGMHEALIHALGSNHGHGFRRTNADKRHAVEMALKDPEISKLKQKEIADICRVTDRAVRKIRNEILAKDSSNGNDRNGSASEKPKVEKAKGNVRDTGEVSQKQVETDELKGALKQVMVLPYDGEMANERLELDADLVADCEYVSTWLSTLVITYRRKGAVNAREAKANE